MTYYITYRSKVNSREYTVWTKEIDVIIENLTLIRNSAQIELVSIETMDC